MATGASARQAGEGLNSAGALPPAHLFAACAARAAALICALAQASNASAQSTAPAAQVPTQNEDIVVVAEPNERTSIDRTTYVVRDTAESRSANVLDLLSHVPFVEVMPTGQVRLLGTGGVRILIDGKEVADANAMLRNLQGSQIAKIEVITNPSAQFSARGTGGIINIVTRRSFASGLGGSVTANGDNFGTAELKASPTWSRGRLSLSGSIDGAHRRQQPSETDQDRTRIDAGGALSPESTEHTINRNRDDNISGNFMIGYRPTTKQTLSLTAFATRGKNRSSATSDLLFFANPADPLRQVSTGRGSIALQDVSADYKRDGRRDGETLTVSARWSALRFPSDQLFLTTDGAGETSAFALHSSWYRSTATLKLDYVRPVDKERRLSFGGAVERSREDTLSREEGQGTPGGPSLALSSEIAGSSLEKSAYVTYQAPLLGGTVLAGFRVEGRRYDFGVGMPAGSGRYHPFPSLHLERKLAKKLTADLSYSRRVNWPEISAINPALRFSDPRNAYVGNSSLRPEITHAFEAKLTLTGKRNVELTAFSRRTEDLFSSLGRLDAHGILTTEPVNFGSRLLRGASIVVQGTIGRRLNYSLTGNLADERLRSNGPVGALAGAGLSYGGSAKLEYRDGSEGRRGADHVTLTARYMGPSYDGFTRFSSYLNADATWSHALTDRISGVLTIADLAGPSRFRFTYVSTDSISRTTSVNRDRRILVSLTYSLAKPPPR